MLAGDEEVLAIMLENKNLYIQVSLMRSLELRSKGFSEPGALLVSLSGLATQICTLPWVNGLKANALQIAWLPEVRAKA